MFAPAAVYRSTAHANAVSSAAGAYRQIGVETGVAVASPHQLVLMLFDGFNVPSPRPAPHCNSARSKPGGAPSAAPPASSMMA